MSPLNVRTVGLLLAPVVIVYVGLVASEVIAADAAVLAAVLTCAGVLWASGRIRTVWDLTQQAHDLADTELHEEFVRQSRLAESYEIILDAIPEPIVVLRNDRRIVQANQALVELLGHDPIDSDLTAALRHPDLVKAADEILAGTVRDRTVEFSRGGEREQHLMARLVRLPNARSGGGAVVIALHDLTALHKTMEMRADFVANVSHELRTPLSTLVGVVETLQGPARDDPEAREKFLALMAEQGTRMTRLVSDLLSLSQIEANEHTRPTEKVKIQDLVPTVARMLEPDARKKGITIELDSTPWIPAVTGDADQLLQVFQNLMHNAVKYGRENSTVRISMREDGGILAVSVADEGEGIAPQHIPRLTERFYRIDKARSRAMGGTGLGLAIVKHILNRHQGRLSVKSDLGAGSTFTVYLPVAGRGADAGAATAD